MLPLLSTALLTLTLVDALNVPSNNPDGSTTVHLSRRKYTHPHKLAPEDFKNYAYTMRKKMAQKYSPNSSDKRASTGDIPLVNQNADVSYFATLQAGTPAVQYSIVLDTGSSDLWLASSQCLQGCNAITNRYDTSKSSSAKGSNQPFSIKYGSGAVAGNVVQDTVSMAGFTIPNQIFGAVTQLSTGVISGSLSGLMGLAFSPLSQTGSTPFTQALAQGNQLTNPLMAFYLTRFIDDPSAQAEEYGGQFTLGNTNSTLFTGDIEYHNNVQSTGGSSYWAIPLKEISVSGTRFGIPANMASAAIDTGTTLIAGPTDAVAQIYSSIQGAQKGTGQLDGFWTYPCNSKINLALNFGGKDWPISEADFMFGQANPTTCVGAIFEIPISGNVIQWIVGDTFLKNVYSVYRFTPPSVGFAQLAPSIAGSTPTGSSGGSGGAAETSRALPTLSNDLPPGITGASGLPIPTPASNGATGTFGSMGWNKVVGCVLGVVAVLMV